MRDRGLSGLRSEVGDGGDCISQYVVFELANVVYVLGFPGTVHAVERLELLAQPHVGHSAAGVVVAVVAPDHLEALQAACEVSLLVAVVGRAGKGGRHAVERSPCGEYAAAFLRFSLRGQSPRAAQVDFVRVRSASRRGGRVNRDIVGQAHDERGWVGLLDLVADLLVVRADAH